jgi:hypothetical protein
MVKSRPVGDESPTYRTAPNELGWHASRIYLALFCRPGIYAGLSAIA